MDLIEERTRLLEELEKVEKEIRISQIPENELLIGKWVKTKDKYSINFDIYMKVKDQERNGTSSWIITGPTISIQKDNNNLIEIDQSTSRIEIEPIKGIEAEVLDEKELETKIKNIIDGALKTLWTS